MNHHESSPQQGQQVTSLAVRLHGSPRRSSVVRWPLLLWDPGGPAPFKRPKRPPGLQGFHTHKEEDEEEEEEEQQHHQHQHQHTARRGSRSTLDSSERSDARCHTFVNAAIPSAMSSSAFGFRVTLSLCFTCVLTAMCALQKAFNMLGSSVIRPY